jgi:hypothetical protein
MERIQTDKFNFTKADIETLIKQHLKRENMTTEISGLNLKFIWPASAFPNVSVEAQSKIFEVDLVRRHITERREKYFDEVNMTLTEYFDQRIKESKDEQN